MSGWGDKSAVNEIDEETGQSALHLAASKGRLAIVAILLSKKASIDVQDNAGRTPLYLAASAGFHGTLHVLMGTYNFIDVVLTLLTSGANQVIFTKKILAHIIRTLQINSGTFLYMRPFEMVCYFFQHYQL